jgi:hypothetical protein
VSSIRARSTRRAGCVRERLIASNAALSRSFRPVQSVAATPP